MPFNPHLPCSNWLPRNGKRSRVLALPPSVALNHRFAHRSFQAACVHRLAAFLSQAKISWHKATSMPGKCRKTFLRLRADMVREAPLQCAIYKDLGATLVISKEACQAKTRGRGRCMCWVSKNQPRPRIHDVVPNNVVLMKSDVLATLATAELPTT